MGSSSTDNEWASSASGAGAAFGETLRRLELDGAIGRLSEALTHPSFANEHKDRVADNQRLEFLGDAVLGLLVGEILMERFPGAKEGELSLLRSNLVSAEALASWARAVGLGPSLRLGRGADAAGERDRDNVLADAAEAVVGAVYLDRGLAAARAIAADIVAQPLATLDARGPIGRDAKSELQERVQAEGGPSPRYRVVGAEGPDHLREFVVEVEVSGVVLGSGRGRSKKLAEQAAARAAMTARAAAALASEAGVAEVTVTEVTVAEVTVAVRVTARGDDDGPEDDARGAHA